MKNYNIPVLALALLALVSCAEKARVKGTLEGAAGKQVVVTRLGAGIVEPVDTVKTKADGSFSFSVPVKKGQPEFIYIYYGDRKVASLLLETGEKAVVSADTLGKYSVTGSEGSAKLHDVEESFNAFARKMASTEDPRELGKAYVDHYRESVKYVLSNPYSLTVIPVLYEQVNNLPVFGQNTDALHFRAAADSLAKVYPDSRYVKALAKEAERREKLLGLATFCAEFCGFQRFLNAFRGSAFGAFHSTDLRDSTMLIFRIGPRMMRLFTRVNTIVSAAA